MGHCVALHPYVHSRRTRGPRRARGGGGGGDRSPYTFLGSARSPVPRRGGNRSSGANGGCLTSRIRRPRAQSTAMPGRARGRRRIAIEDLFQEIKSHIDSTNSSSTALSPERTSFVVAAATRSRWPFDSTPGARATGVSFHVRSKPSSGTLASAARARVGKTVSIKRAFGHSVHANVAASPMTMPRMADATTPMMKP